MSGWKLEFTYHLIAWGVPLIYVIIPTAAGEMAYEPTGVYCFISSSDNYAWVIACWFVPMGIILVGGTIGMFLCCFWIYKKVTFSDISRSKLVPLIRLSTCLLIFWVAIALIFVAQIYGTATLSAHVYDLVNYLVCILSSGILGTEPACRNAYLGSMNQVYNLQMASSFFMCALGVLLSIFFASSAPVISSIVSTTRGNTGLSSSNLTPTSIN